MERTAKGIVTDILNCVGAGLIGFLTVFVFHYTSSESSRVGELDKRIATEQVKYLKYLSSVDKKAARLTVKLSRNLRKCPDSLSLNGARTADLKPL